MKDQRKVGRETVLEEGDLETGGLNIMHDPSLGHGLKRNSHKGLFLKLLGNVNTHYRLDNIIVRTLAFRGMVTVFWLEKRTSLFFGGA